MPRTSLLVALVALVWAAPALAGDAAWPALDRVPAGLERDGGNDAALVIAIENYAFAPDLPGARQNAVDWTTFFEDGKGVRVVKPLLDDQAAREDILSEIGKLAAKVKRGGKFWLVFIGHGAPTRDGSDALIEGVDARQTASSLESRGVRRTEIADAIVANLVEGATAVVILDACFSGQTASGDLAPGLAPLRSVELPTEPRVTFLTAAKNDQYAGPLPDGSRPAFSYFLLGALRGWGDDDRVVTVSEAVEFVDGALLKTISGRNQNPTFDGSDLVLAQGGREATPKFGSFAAKVVAPATASSSSGFSDLKMDVQSRLREQDCQAQARDDGTRARADRLEDAVISTQKEASDAWTRLKADGERCLALTEDSARAECASTLEAFVARAEGASARLPEAVEQVSTGCGMVEVAFGEESEMVQIATVADAKALAQKLRVPVPKSSKATAPTTKVVEESHALTEADVEPAAKSWSEAHGLQTSSSTTVSRPAGGDKKTGDILLYTSFGAGAAAATSLIVAGVMRDSYLTADSSSGEQPELVELNQVLGYGGYSLAVAAAGLFTVGAVVRW